MSDPKNEELMRLVHRQLELVGENPERDGLKRTPLRVAKSWAFLTQGYQKDPKDVLNGALFEAKSDEMVIVKDIDFYSLCEHHLLPFFGKCHVAYLPTDRVIGLSKLPRLVEVFARRLQVQERMTHEIASTIDELIKPQGVGVIVEGQHLCMMMRGVEKQNSVMTTSCMLGAFRERPSTRTEFLSLLNRSS